MSIRGICYLLGVMVSIFSFNAATAQAGLCPSNLDFESGTFANWTCRWGTVSVAPGVNTVSLTGTGQIPGRHTIDGLNDVVTPYLIGMKSLKSFSVFNRWGNRVFYSTKYGEGWNGKFNGTDQDAGVFVWVLEFIDLTDKKVVEKGTLALIR